jgi:hypothetical protein
MTAWCGGCAEAVAGRVKAAFMAVLSGMTQSPPGVSDLTALDELLAPHG